MLWKQIHKAGLIKEIYTEGEEIEIYFDKGDFRQIFTL